jgi:anti-sigma factor RsiW
LQELTDYLDGTISVTVREELEEHLQWCHECYVVLDTTKKTIAIYRDSQIFELPENLRTRLHEAIISKCKQSKSGGKTST